MNFLEIEDEAIKYIDSLIKRHELNLDFLILMRDYLLLPLPLLKGKEAKNNEKSYLYDSNKRVVDAFIDKYKVKSSLTSYLFDNVSLLDLNEFTSNPYYKLLNNISFEDDGWRLSHATIKPYELFVKGESYAQGKDLKLFQSIGYFKHQYNYPTISCNGNEWMSLKPLELETMKTPILLAKGKVLTFGLGLGYFAYMASIKESVREVHVVEKDQNIIHLFKKYILPHFPNPQKIIIHNDDAYNFAKNIKDKEYNFIFIDIYHDVSDGITCYLKFKHIFYGFKFSQISFWIEESLFNYFRLLLIGAIENEYLVNDIEDLDFIQRELKRYVASLKIDNLEDFENLLKVKNIKELIISDYFI